MLFLDGVYVVTPPYGNRPRFQGVREPTSAQRTQLAHTIALRLGQLLEHDAEQFEFSDALDEEDPTQAMEALRLSAPAE